jgi:hypothetical protein
VVLLSEAASFCSGVGLIVDAGFGCWYPGGSAVRSRDRGLRSRRRMDPASTGAMSIREADRETEFAWELKESDSPARERLEALDVHRSGAPSYAATRPGSALR